MWRTRIASRVVRDLIRRRLFRCCCRFAPCQDSLVCSLVHDSEQAIWICLTEDQHFPSTSPSGIHPPKDHQSVQSPARSPSLFLDFRSRSVVVTRAGERGGTLSTRATEKEKKKKKSPVRVGSRGQARGAEMKEGTMTADDWTLSG